MKKFLQILFVFYVLFLALKPCLGDHTVEYFQPEGIVHVEEQQTEDHYDQCSPLCSCLCCNTNISIVNSFDITYIFNYTEIHTPYLINLTPTILNPVSPPPRS